MNYPNIDKDNHLKTAEDYLGVVCQNSSIINNTLSTHGEKSLGEYLRSLRPNNDLPYQQRNDVIDIIYDYSKALLGESIARQTAQDLEKFPVVLTANHHGVDYFSHSVQGSLLFSFARQTDTDSFSTIPVFSCGNIPLNNPTYPRGLLLYRSNNQGLEAIPKKLTIFPDRLKRSLVSFVSPFDLPMIERAEKRLYEMVRKGQICSKLLEPILMIFKEDYREPHILGLPAYSHQAVVLNNLIWKRLFSKQHMDSQIVYIEIEKIVSKLLKFDLSNTDSLIWSVFFDPVLREHIIDELEGLRACWNREKLMKRLSMDRLEPIERKELNGCGTLFFWGIDPSGRRIPLYLETNGHKNAMLLGIDDREGRWEFAFTPKTIFNALNENRLMPSLFTCYLVIAMARGIRCIGGYFQSEYLPRMLKGVVSVLGKNGSYNNMAVALEKVNPNFYLSGMSAIMTKVENDFLLPAGSAEIIAGGGLNNADIERILSLSVRDAHLASLFEILPDFTPWISKTSDWKTRLARNSLQLLKGKVVIK